LSAFAAWASLRSRSKRNLTRCCRNSRSFTISVYQRNGAFTPARSHRRENSLAHQYPADSMTVLLGIRKTAESIGSDWPLLGLRIWCESGEVRHFPISFLLAPRLQRRFLCGAWPPRKTEPLLAAQGPPPPGVAPFHHLTQKPQKVLSLTCGSEHLKLPNPVIDGWQAAEKTPFPRRSPSRRPNCLRRGMVFPDFESKSLQHPAKPAKSFTGFNLLKSHSPKS
jgi:hypothetical protein